MKNSKQTAKKPASEAVVLETVASFPEATAAGVAGAAGIGRSTASKILAQLVSSGEVRRTEGGRDGGRRLPDRFTLKAAEGDDATADEDGKPRAVKGGKSGAADERGTPKATDERLKPGQLDELVLAYLKKNADSGPHGPSTVAKALERSSGAVGNCLVRLTKSKQVRQRSDKPRRYSLASGR